MRPGIITEQKKDIGVYVMQEFFRPVRNKNREWKIRKKRGKIKRMSKNKNKTHTEKNNLVFKREAE